MLYGGILGDISGSRFEEDSWKKKLSSIPYNFELLTKECQFTDDTVLMVALADTFCNNTSWIDRAKEYAMKYPAAGYGGNFVKWVRASKATPYHSYGNGSAMRVAAVGYASENWEECMENATISAKITHDHPEGIKGAKAVAGAIYLARRLKASKEQIKTTIEREIGYNLSRPYNKIKENYGFKVSCQESVPEAIIAFLESESVEDAIRKAICLKGDTDTMACIAGNIAEAFYGDIDKVLEKEVKNFLNKELIEVIEQFNDKFKI